jgi:hypothetical protein
MDSWSLHDLYASYALGLDGGDFERVLGCFAEDATYEVVGSYVVHGRMSIGERIRSRHQHGRTHLTGNILLEDADAGGVHGQATFVLLDDRASVIACGEYDDHAAVGPSGKWEFVTRRISYRANASSKGHS